MQTRQILPRHTTLRKKGIRRSLIDLSGYSQEQHDALADEIDHCRRKGLGVRSPLAVYSQLLLSKLNTPPYPLKSRGLHLEFEFVSVINQIDGPMITLREGR